MEKKKGFLALWLVLFLSLVFFNVWGISRLKKLSLGGELSLPLPTPAPTSVLLPIPDSQPIILMVVGDVMLARSVTTKMRSLGDFAYPFAKTAEKLSEVDLTLVNLESPFGANCPSLDTGMKFCADYRGIEGLIESGVDLVSLANNHALDQGEAGLAETVQLIEENLMAPIGLREPVFLEIKGIKLVFLAYNTVLPRSDLVSWGYPDFVESEIKRFSQEADVLVVYFHWGQEYAETPRAGSGGTVDPRKLGRLAVDAGADLVLGTHPHVVQENEWYKGKLIVYSLGNFVFDQGWSKETQKGMVGKFVLGKDGLIKSEFLPVEIVDYQPRFETESVGLLEESS